MQKLTYIAEQDHQSCGPYLSWNEGCFLLDIKDAISFTLELSGILILDRRIEEGDKHARTLFITTIIDIFFI